MTRILTIEDDAVSAREIIAELSRHGLDVHWVDDEMSARVEALLSDQGALREPATRLRIDDLELDLISRAATRAGQVQLLLPTEYKLLEFLMRHPGQIVSRMTLFEQVWGYHFDPGTNLVDVHIGRLRKKLHAPALAPLIHTVRGAGYRLGTAP